MDGVELKRHVSVDDGEEEERGMKPQPHPASQKHSPLPVDDPEEHDAMLRQVPLAARVLRREAWRRGFACPARR